MLRISLILIASLALLPGCPERRNAAKGQPNPNQPASHAPASAPAKAGGGTEVARPKAGGGTKVVQPKPGAGTKAAQPTFAKEDGGALSDMLKHVTEIDVQISQVKMGNSASQRLKDPAAIKELFSMLKPEQTLKGNRKPCPFAMVLTLYGEDKKKIGEIACCTSKSKNGDGAYINNEEKEWRLIIPDVNELMARAQALLK